MYINAVTNWKSISKERYYFLLNDDTTGIVRYEYKIKMLIGIMIE